MPEEEPKLSWNTFCPVDPVLDVDISLTVIKWTENISPTLADSENLRIFILVSDAIDRLALTDVRESLKLQCNNDPGPKCELVHEIKFTLEFSGLTHV